MIKAWDCFRIIYILDYIQTFAWKIASKLSAIELQKTVVHVNAKSQGPWSIANLAAPLSKMM